jgi:DUF2934 family protein
LPHFGKVVAAAVYFSEKRPMAKRTASRSESNQAAPARQARPKTRRSQPPSASTGAGPTEDDIRRRAYQRYLDRGGDHGTDFEDWLAAERELKSSKSEV